MIDEVATRIGPVVQTEFGVDVVAWEPVSEGLDDADVWRASATDGHRYAVKWSAGGTDAGLLVPDALSAAGSPHVVAPLHTRAGRPWCVAEGRRLSVTPWIDGPSGLAGSWRPADWCGLGRVLRAAHDLPVTGALADALPQEQYDPSAWLDAANRADRRLEENTAGDDDLVDEVRGHWRAGRDRILRVRDRAAALSRRIRSRPDPPRQVVCHGDAHVGNAILGTDGPVLLDWDDAVLGPPERDLMFVLTGVIWFAPVGAEAQEWFTVGYGRPLDCDPEILAYVRCVRALTDVAEPAERVLSPQRWGRDEREEAAAIVAGVLSPTGLVSLALTG